MLAHKVRLSARGEGWNAVVHVLCGALGAAYWPERWTLHFVWEVQHPGHHSEEWAAGAKQAWGMSFGHIALLNELHCGRNSTKASKGYRQLKLWKGWNHFIFKLQSSPLTRGGKISPRKKFGRQISSLGIPTKFFRTVLRKPTKFFRRKICPAKKLRRLRGHFL